MWEALAPTQSAQRSPIMVLTSTAGHVDSVLLRFWYDRLVRQATGAEDPDPSFYGVWWQSRDPDAGLDWPELNRANPALADPRGIYLHQAIISEHRIFPPDQWRRERMNHFVDKRVDSAIAPNLWANCRVRQPLQDVTGPFALGVDIAPNAVRATIAVAAIRPDGRIGVEVFRDLRAGEEFLTSDRVVKAIHEFSAPLAYVAYDKVTSIAAALDRDAQDSGLPYDGLQPAAMMAASMDVAEMISSGRLAVDDPLLDAQAPNVARRDIGSEGGFRYSRGVSEGPIDAFMAMALAAHAIAYTLRLPQVF